jgi:ubiquinone/menaquinone biosynthesis C-methylase UbiE
MALVTLLVPVALHGTQSNEPEADRIFAALGLTEGSTACEIGAGSGALSIAAARVVGPAGRVYTNELGDSRVNTLKKKVTDSGLGHIEVVTGSVTGTNFPDGACDGLFMRDVYHHFTDPAAMNTAIVRALKPGGRVAVVDFTPPGKEGDTPADRARDGTHGTTPDTVTREMEQAGLRRLSAENGGRWFVVVFGRS